jgi:chaperonin cofactor prefoldin
LESQNQALKRELKVSVITASHIDKLPEGTSTYESIGKAYFKKPKEDILSDLEKTIEASDEALKSIKTKRETIEKDQQELKKEIAEQINALRKE